MNISKLLRGFELLALFIIFRPFSRRKAPRNIQKIIVPAYTGLGNFIMKTSMIRALREAFPEAYIVILAGNSYGTEFVLEGSNTIDEIIIHKQDSSFIEKIRFAFKLRKEHYDLIFMPFDASPDFLRVESLIADIPMRIGHHWKEIYKTLQRFDPFTIFLTHPIALKAGRHEIDLNLDLLVPLGIDNVTEKETFISVPRDVDVSHLVEWDLSSRAYWCVQLGAASGLQTTKRWDPIKFAEALDMLIEKYNIPIIALGDKYDVNIYNQVQEQMKNKLIDCVGKTVIQEVAFLIKHSCLLLCHDSGLMHMAVALKTPVVAIYGPTDYTRTQPIGTNHILIRKDIECAPCMYAFARTENEIVCSHRNCMKSIEVKDVVDAVSKVLETKIFNGIVGK